MVFVLIGIYRVSFTKNVYAYLFVLHSVIVYNYLINNVLGHWLKNNSKCIYLATGNSLHQVVMHVPCMELGAIALYIKLIELSTEMDIMGSPFTCTNSS